ncbi:MAG: cache and HAMP domain-containing protein [Cyanobacteria bacterium J06592_8]
MNNLISIRYVLTLLIVSPLIVATGATALLGFTSGSRAVTFLTQRFSKKAILAIERHLESYLGIPELANKINGVIVGTNLIDPNEFESLARYLEEKIEAIESVNYIYFGDRNGDFIGVKKVADGQMRLVLRDAINEPRLEMYEINAQGGRGKLIETLKTEYDARDRPWYKKAIEFGEIAWSPIYIFASSQELGITSTIPIYEPENESPTRNFPEETPLQRQENIIGVFGIDLGLKELSDFLVNLDISPRGDAFIIDRTGYLVASSTDEPPFSTENGQLQQLLAIESEKPIIRVTVEHLLETRSSLMQIQDLTSLEYTLQNQRHLVQVAPLQENGLDWLVFVVIPEQDFMELIYSNLRFTFIIGSGVTIVAIILGTIASFWIIKPIGDLNTCAKAIKSNTLDVEILEKIAARPDEIGELGQTFLEMAEIVNAREKSMSDKLTELRSQNEQWRRTLHHNQELRIESFNDLLKRAKQTRVPPSED